MNNLSNKIVWDPNGIVLPAACVSEHCREEMGFDLYLKRVYASYGRLLRQGPTGNTVLNHQTMALLLVYDLNLFYDAETRTFSYRNTGGRYSPQTTESVMQYVTNSLLRFAQLTPRFPMSELRLSRIEALVEEIKKIVTFSRSVVVPPTISSKP